MSKEIFNFKPFEDRILIDPIKIADEEVTASGIVVQRTNQTDKTPFEGYVVAVGPGRVGHDSGVLQAMNVAVGDRVQWSKYSGHILDINNVEYLLMRQSDILGLIIEPVAKSEPCEVDCSNKAACPE